MVASAALLAGLAPIQANATMAAEIDRSKATSLGGTDAIPSNGDAAAYDLLAQAMRAKTYVEVKSLLERALALVPQPGPLRGKVACTLASRIYEESTDVASLEQEAANAADQCYRLMPDDADAQFLAGVAKIENHQLHQGGLLLLSAIKKQPEVLDNVEIASMQGYFRMLHYAHENITETNLRMALIKAGYGKDDSDFFGEMAVNSIADYIAQQDAVSAIALLPQIVGPEYGLRMLIDRRFEPIWPAVEQWAGGNLNGQRDANLAAVLSQFRVDPSLPNRRVLADAFWGAGRHAEAKSLLAEAVEDSKLWDDDRFYISLMTARYAKMLIYDGQLEAAIATAIRVNTANPASKYQYAVNLMPNFASLLIATGHAKDALELLDRETPSERILEAPAALGFYVALRFCAYHSLGRESEAKAQAAMLAARYASNEPAAHIASTCSVTPETEQGMWTQDMMDDDTRAKTLVTFYRAKLGIKTINSIDDFGADFLGRDNPGLQATFRKLGRELPASFLPALRMWEEPAAVPVTHAVR
ncbi:MAG: hypothetical protein B7Z36_02180 [Novosphingobium sp. 12-63-9]|nr:MAG: hypothetical protein B7Z36_02180 [Novosphingobium sp. 12-63-9]